MVDWGVARQHNCGSKVRCADNGRRYLAPRYATANADQPATTSTIVQRYWYGASSSLSGAILNTRIYLFYLYYYYYYYYYLGAVSYTHLTLPTIYSV